MKVGPPTASRLAFAARAMQQVQPRPSARLSGLILKIRKVLTKTRAQLRVSALDNEGTRRFGFGAWQAVISDDAGTYEGYSLGNTAEQAMLAIVEAYERYAFLALHAATGAGDVHREDVPFDLVLDHGSLGPRLWVNPKACARPDSPSFSRFFLGYDAAQERPAALARFFSVGDGTSLPLTTSGTACHLDIPRAMLHALLEVAERDVVLTHWIKGRPPRLARPVLRGDCRQMASALYACGFSLTHYSYPVLGGAATSLAVIKNLRRAPPFIIAGAAADFSSDRAAQKSLAEAFRIWLFDYFWIKAGKKVSNASGDNQSKSLYSPEACSRLEDYLKRALPAGRTRTHGTDVASLVRRYKPVFIPLMPPSGSEIPPCIRAFSASAVPMFFGDLPPFLPASLRPSLARFDGAAHPL